MLSNLENFVFFDSTSSGTESSELANPNRGQLMTVQISGTPSSGTNVVFKGKVDYNASSFENLTIFKASEGYKIVSAITEDGIYSIDMTGVTTVKAVCTQGVGTVKVFGILIG